MALHRSDSPPWRLICVGSLGFLVLSACTGAGGGSDAGAGMDASAPAPAAPIEGRDAGWDAGWDGGALDAAVDPRDVVRAQIRALEELLAGRLPTDVDPQTLFEADLLDEQSRLERIRSLEARLAQVPDAGPPDAGSDAGTPDAGAIAPDGEVPDLDADLDAGFDAGQDAGSALDGGPLDEAGPVELDAGFDAGRPDAAVPLGELELLELERDRLRLAFLRLPEAQRTRAIEAVRARRRIQIEEHAASAVRERATQDARRAEGESDELFSQAAGSASTVESTLLSERARLASVRADFARWEVRAARRREEEARSGAARLSRIHALERRLDHVDEDEADEMYEDVVGLLVVERAGLNALLDELDAPSEAPSFDLSVDLSEPPYRGLAGTRELREAIAELERDRRRAVGEEQRLRWAWADRKADGVRALDEIRVDLLPRMSRARRAEVMGLGAEGRAQLGRELEQIAVLARYWAREAWHDLPTMPSRLGGLAVDPSTRIPFALALLLIVGIVVIWREREALTARLHAAIHVRSPVSQRSWIALVRPFWAVLGPLAIPLALLVALHVVIGLFDHLVTSLFMDFVRVLVLRLAWFFFLVTLVARFFVSRLRHGAGRARTTARIFSSVRMVMGFGLAALLITDVSELLVGHGYIYSIVVDLAWLGAIPIAIVLIHQWADDVCEAHRQRWTTGFVARALDKKSSSARRYALTPVAGLALGAAGAYAGLEELALRFEQFRRALAFLFRRRLERQVERVVDEAQVEALPEVVRAAFAETPGDLALEIDHFPRLEATAARVAEALDPDEPGLALALVGERGIGKTTWLRALARRLEAHTTMLDVPHRLTTPEDVCRWLSRALELPETGSIEELAASIEALDEPRVIVLDHCQNLVVRAIGGTDGLEALVNLAALTSRRLVWICSFSLYTWRYLERARQRQDLFREHLLLEAWSEEEIARLIRHRMAGTGLEVSYRDLVVEKLAGSALEDAILRTEGEYLRLLWDFAGGNPRVAIHFWKHSIVALDGGLRVRLFVAPDDDELDELHQTSLFLLATIALHENATLDEAATSAGSPARECSAQLAFLRDRGYLKCDDTGHWRLSTHWYRVITRHLRRHRLLFD